MPSQICTTQSAVYRKDDKNKMGKTQWRLSLCKSFKDVALIAAEKTRKGFCHNHPAG